VPGKEPFAAIFNGVQETMRWALGRASIASLARPVRSGATGVFVQLGLTRSSEEHVSARFLSSSYSPLSPVSYLRFYSAFPHLRQPQPKTTLRHRQVFSGTHQPSTSPQASAVNTEFDGDPHPTAPQTYDNANGCPDSVAHTVTVRRYPLTRLYGEATGDRRMTRLTV
jgi:hypothetical protein